MAQPLGQAEVARRLIKWHQGTGWSKGGSKILKGVSHGGTKEAMIVINGVLPEPTNE